MQLYQKILIGLGLGIVFGLTAHALDLEWLRNLLISIGPIGTGFIRLITMIVIPLARRITSALAPRCRASD